VFGEECENLPEITTEDFTSNTYDCKLIATESSDTCTEITLPVISTKKCEESAIAVYKWYIYGVSDDTDINMAD